MTEVPVNWYVANTDTTTTSSGGTITVTYGPTFMPPAARVRYLRDGDGRIHLACEVEPLIGYLTLPGCESDTNVLCEPYELADVDDAAFCTRCMRRD